MLFKEVGYSLSKLIEDIDGGEIALPEIQRPFVWSRVKVRDLFDSMYGGFPVGYLLFWGNVGANGARQIGIGTKQAVPRLLIVDGQQRLTSLYAVLKGLPVVHDDYTASRIKIAFRPRDEHFAVADAAVERDPEFIPDISQLWAGASSRNRFVKQFLERLSQSRELSDEEEDRLDDALNRLYDLQGYRFTALELSSTIDEEKVAEVFVRINSKGVALNQADFILTLMSVWWDKGRKQLEDFCRASRRPSVDEPTPFNHIVAPDPDQLLRVAVGLGFRRGQLKAVYSLLRGRALDSGESSPDQRESQFAVLRDAQAYALDLTSWHEFLQAVERAGYSSKRLITSEGGLLFSYIFYLIGKRDFAVPTARLQRVISRWFFMVALTARYSSSAESRLESDLADLRDLTTADEFVDLLEGTIEDVLTSDFWRITLPNALATSTARSPALYAYYAALNVLDARVLLSSLSVREWLDPRRTKDQGIERQRLFPQRELKRLGFDSSKDANQIANFALVEWPETEKVAALPATYWPAYSNAIAPAELDRVCFWHGLPPGWETLAYDDFLAQRRQALAAVIKTGYERLLDTSGLVETAPRIAEL
ncbi:MAG TPA: DUF262 domain-containing protein, partial [Thermoleophilaceae bacterium]